VAWRSPFNAFRVSALNISEETERIVTSKAVRVAEAPLRLGGKKKAIL
jgi:hypothetical protein